MKKMTAVLFSTLLLLVSMKCFAETTSFTYRFANAEEAGEMLLANRDYYDNMGREDVNYRMQKTDATIEDLKAFIPGQMLDFSDEEKAAIGEGLDAIAKICDERGYHLPDEGEIVFAKTTMAEECDAGAYTHGTQIYFGERVLAYAQDRPDMFHEVLAHELFHCLTRSDPDFRRDMYEILGFTVADEDYVFPQEVKDRIISNPDVEHHNSHAAFTINGEEKECTVIFTTTKPFENPGDMFFEYEMTGLVPIDDLSTVYPSDDASDFWDVFGRNTTYVIDPEETLADNFRFTIVYGPDGKEYENAEIIEKIDEYLRR